VALEAILVLGFGLHLKVGASVLLSDLTLLAALLPLKLRRGLSSDDLGLRPAPIRQSIPLVIGALVAYFFVAIVWLGIVHPPKLANILAGVKSLSPTNVVLAVIAVAFVAPIVEEIFFRGFLYRTLRNRFEVIPAALLGGAVFGLAHALNYPASTLPVKAAFGVIACLLYERTGSLLPGIALHSFVDASGIDLALTGNILIALAATFAITTVLLLWASTHKHDAHARARGSRRAAD
jgi:membrane protease YdiL (CAAX protease family)